VAITAEIKKNPLFANDVVEVQHVPGKGYGLYTLKAYAEGEIITHYEGVRVRMASTH
jgi:hypothetical protein